MAHGQASWWAQARQQALVQGDAPQDDANEPTALVIGMAMLGALVCWAVEWASAGGALWQRLPAEAAIAVGFLLAQWLNTDYGGWGVLLVLLFYMSRQAKGKLVIQLLGLGVFCWLCSPWRGQLLALLAMLPIALYNGERGFSGKALQYGFYAFYPVHILILSVLAQYVF